MERGGHVAAHLLGEVIKHLVIAVAVADLALHLGALKVRLLLGLGLGHQGPNSPELVLAVSDKNLLAQLPVDLNAEHFYSLSQDMKEKQENEVKIRRLETENEEMKRMLGKKQNACNEGTFILSLIEYIFYSHCQSSNTA